jgi:hypothetical protein
LLFTKARYERTISQMKHTHYQMSPTGLIEHGGSKYFLQDLPTFHPTLHIDEEDK